MNGAQWVVRSLRERRERRRAEQYCGDHKRCPSHILSSFPRFRSILPNRLSVNDSTLLGQTVAVSIYQTNG